jgi:AraC family transcriptional regulator
LLSRLYILTDKPARTGQETPAPGQEEHAEMASVIVNAELRVPVATAQICRFEMDGSTDSTFTVKDSYWLDLCLTPRPNNSRARYADRWAPHRFERVGSVFMAPPGHLLQFRTDGGAQSSVVCQLRPEALTQWFEQDLEWTDRRLEASLDVSNANIRNLLLRLGQEMRYPGFASEALTELIAAQLAIELGRYCTAIDETNTAGGLASWRLRLIDERLAEVREAPTLAELARICSLSVRQLTRGFRASRGCSIGDYVAQSRIEAAKRRLTGDESVKAVAHAMGFASPSSFSYAFRRATGMTPRQFRQRLIRGGG